MPFPARCLWCAVVLCWPAVVPAAGATLPANFTESIVATGLQRPTAMTFAPDGRLFVCEQGGQLRVISGGSLLATPFVTVLVDSSGERGLLGVAFDPSFPSNHFVYIYYTATTPNTHNRVSRFVANGDVAVAGSETAIIDLEPLSSATNHNGGAIHFGPDGKLYVAVGENANGSNSQTLTNRLGKMLRVNADGTIPADNPFYAVASGLNRSIWALGLRNPFTFAFQSVGGAMFINDVGQSAWEEIDRGQAGANYGWPITEGFADDPRFVNPIYAYDHSNGCAISGAAFYNPPMPRFPSQFTGAYFFADYCGGWIEWRAPAGAITTFATGISFPVDLAVSRDGRLYYLARGTGAATGIVGRVDYALPNVTITANGTHGSVTLAPGDSLTIAVAFSTGAGGPINPAEAYLGLATETTTMWFDPATGTFVATAAPAYTGALGAFGLTTVLTIADVSTLAPGRYWWFVVIDNDANGVPNGTFLDFTRTVIQ